jgi:predicted HTH domain antitoxin
MTLEEVGQEIAILLLEIEKLPLSHASRLAAMNRLQFQYLPASRGIHGHDDTVDFAVDLKI